MKNSHRFFFYPKLYLADLLNTPKIPLSTQVFCGRKDVFFLYFCGLFPERCFLFPECFSFPETNVFRFQSGFLFLLFGSEPSRKAAVCISFPTGCCSCNENMLHHTPKSNSIQSMEPSYCNSNPDIQIPEHHFWYAEKMSRV